MQSKLKYFTDYFSFSAFSYFYEFPFSLFASIHKFIPLILLPFVPNREGLWEIFSWNSREHYHGVCFRADFQGLANSQPALILRTLRHCCRWETFHFSDDGPGQNSSVDIGQLSFFARQHNIAAYPRIQQCDQRLWQAEKIIRIRRFQLLNN